MTQQQRLINAFKSGQKLSTYSACVKKLTTKLPTRVGELTELGYVFKKEWIAPKDKKGHFIYSLDIKNTPKKLLK